MTIGLSLVGIVLVAIQILIQREIVKRLREAHADTWMRMGRPYGDSGDTSQATPEFLADDKLSDFLLKGNAAKLGDDDLNKLVLFWRLFGLLWVVIAGIGIVLAIIK